MKLKGICRATINKKATERIAEAPTRVIGRGARDGFSAGP
jgi:hypothetical protein